MKNLRIKGIEQVESRLNKEIQKIVGRSRKGLIEAAILIRNDMDKTPPVIPVRFGNLRSSWFTTPVRTGVGIGLTIGFSANYATYVHERVEGAPWGEGVVGSINWNRPNSGPKFFEAALNRNHQVILETIRKNAKVK